MPCETNKDDLQQLLAMDIHHWIHSSHEILKRSMTRVFEERKKKNTTSCHFLLTSDKNCWSWLTTFPIVYTIHYETIGLVLPLHHKMFMHAKNGEIKTVFYPAPHTRVLLPLCRLEFKGQSLVPRLCHVVSLITPFRQMQWNCQLVAGS